MYGAKMPTKKKTRGQKADAERKTAEAKSTIKFKNPFNRFLLIFIFNIYFNQLLIFIFNQTNLCLHQYFPRLHYASLNMILTNQTDFGSI